MTSLAELANKVRYHYYKNMYERRYRLRADGETPLSAFGFENPDYVNHVASPWLTLRRVLPPREVGGEDVLLDLGAGMGRMVVVAAATYELGCATGVEVVPELAARARGNIERNRRRLRSPALISRADARTASVDDLTSIIFMFNPFTGAVFKDAMARVMESLARRPRRLRVVYHNPVEIGHLHHLGFRDVREHKSRFEDRTVLLERA